MKTYVVDLRLIAQGSYVVFCFYDLVFPPAPLATFVGVPPPE